MFLIYLDDSGKPDGTEGNFVIAGVIVHEGQWLEIDEKINALKRTLFGDDWELYEFHMAEILRGEKLYYGKSIDERVAICNGIYDLISSINCRVVGAVIRKKEIYKGVDMENWAYTFTFERICWNLKDMNDGLKASGLREEKGIMIMDSINKDYDEMTRRKLRSIVRDGTFYQDNEHLIEDPLFTDSTWRNLSQIADCVAYTINHHHRVPEQQHKDRDKCACVEDGFKIINQKIVRNGTSTQFSLKVFP